ncbi:MAG: enoyl-CoA hydratase/isomerase family protein [Gammaproteobacteria bacterium]|nr:MAG: enoyl-CoA hydratase/isomerase family protein [Gammaproteobacteria bacterium]
MDFKTIEYATDGLLAILTLNRPDKLNAINGQMVADLNAALDAAEADEHVRVILLNGNGRAFSAGFDLDGGADAGDHIALRKELREDFDIIMRFWDSPKITIAAVHGYCLGSAMEMAVACDLTIAAEGCRFGAPEVKFGSGIIALVLPWFIGPKRAKELLLTGIDDLSAETAGDYGLVNRVVPGAELMECARSLANDIARNDSLAVRLTKQAINRGYDIAGMRQALLQALEIDTIVEGTETDESRQFNQVLEKDGVRAAVAWRDARVRGASDDAQGE